MTTIAFMQYMAQIYRIVNAMMQYTQYQKTSMLSKQDIDQLKERLPRGYFKKVCERVTVSKRSVSNFFEGKIYSLEVHQAVLDEIEVFEAEKAELLERQNSLIHAK